MEDFDAKAAAAGNDIAAKLMLRQIYRLLADADGGGTRKLTEWRDEIETQLNRDVSSLPAFEAVTWSEMQKAALRTIRSVFEPITDRTPKT